MELSEVADRLAIRDLVDRYADALTRRDWAALSATFADDAIWSLGEPYNAEIKGAAEIARGIAQSLKPYEHLVQMVHSTAIEFDQGGARARTIINEHGRRRDGAGGTFLLGIYHDHFQRDGRGWRFRSRRAEVIFLNRDAPQGQTISAQQDET